MRGYRIVLLGSIGQRRWRGGWEGGDVTVPNRDLLPRTRLLLGAAFRGHAARQAAHRQFVGGRGGTRRPILGARLLRRRALES